MAYAENAENTAGKKRRYFDWAATAVPDRGCFDAPFGNPSSRHQEGRAARDALEDARARCAAALGVLPERLYFTSGGTESNAAVLYALLLRQSGGAILASGAEHPSIRENCLVLERLGKRVGFIGVEKTGAVSAATLAKALAKYPDTRLAAIMGVNNETGAHTDLAALSDLAGGVTKNIHLHCDMVQAVGKVPVDLAYVDSASFSAHKIGGPRGIGLLYLRKPLVPLYTGGGQERGVRAGTENVAGALALAECLERRAVPAAVAAEYAKAGERFARLLQGLRLIPGCRSIPEDRRDWDARFSPYILQAACAGIPGEVMVRALDDAGFAVSTGSACSSGTRERPVLAAMGVDPQTALEGFRISQGWTTTPEAIDALLNALGDVAAQLRYI